MYKKKIMRIAHVPESLEILLKGQLNYINQSENFELIAISSPGTSLQKIHINENVKIYEVKIERRLSVLNDIIAVFKLYKIFKDNRPFIVHSHTPKAGLVSMLASFLARVPNRIHTFTGLIFPYKRGLYKLVLIFVDKTICFFANKIIPEGLGVKNDLIKYRITRKPLQIIENGNINGIDSVFFNPLIFDNFKKNNLKEKLNINPKDFVYIFIGRLVKDKGIDDLIFVFEKIQKEHNDVKLILVGEFENKLDPLLQKTLKSINNNSSILHLGFQHDVRPYLAVSNLLVFPSYREGFPNVPLQAAAMSLPLLLSNISGCNEIVEENVNGLLFEPGHIDDLQSKMIWFKTNPDLTNILKNNARASVIKKFDQKNIWDSMINVYNQLDFVNNKFNSPF